MSLLRASSEASGSTADLGAVTDGAGVEHGDLLTAFATAAVTGDGDLAAARDALRAAVGDAGVVEAAATISGFEGLNRVADATGIQLDEGLESASGELRDELDLGRFAGSANTGDRGIEARRETSVMDLFR